MTLRLLHNEYSAATTDHYANITRWTTMDPRAEALLKLADDIAEMHRRLVLAAGSDFEFAIKLGLARLQWILDGLIDDSEGVIDVMPWWEIWKSGRPGSK